MPTIVTAQQVEIRDSRFRRLGDAIASSAVLAVHRAIANTADARRFPLPRDGAFERAALELFRSLPRERQDIVRQRVLADVDRDVPRLRRLNLRQPLTAAEFAGATTAEALILPRLLTSPLTLTSDDFQRLPSVASRTVRAVPPTSPSPAPGTAVAVGGSLTIPPTPQEIIDTKYASLGGAQGFLGPATSGHGTTPGGIGHFRHYTAGSIYYVSWTGAHEVHGAIREKWTSIGWEQSPLGFPTTDELKAPDGRGRYNHFENGSIYWTPETGAHALDGPVHEKWKQLGWEKSVLGYPTTDIGSTPDGIGRFAHFEHGSIYWTPNTGAHEVHGAIHAFWKAQGWEQGPLGYPVSDEMEVPGGRQSVFQGGAVGWTPGGGAFHASPKPLSSIGLRLLSLHCIDETGLKGTGGEIGKDDMRMGGVAVAVSGKSTTFGPHDLGQYNDGTWSDWPAFVTHSFSIDQQDGIWPKAVIATMVLVEKDHGGYSEFLQKVMTKVEEIVQEKVKEAAAAAGAAVGAALGGLPGAIVGAIAGYVAAYVVEKLFDAIAEIFDDDIFYPITVHAVLPGPGALFAHGTYDSGDGYCWAKGHHGHYEWWIDWVVA